MMSHSIFSVGYAVLIGAIILMAGLLVGIPMVICYLGMAIIDNTLALVMRCFNLTMEDA
jgi:hypothetical protein